MKTKSSISLILALSCVLFVALVTIPAPAQTFTNLVIFSLDGVTGSQPYQMNLIQATDGNLYGTTLNGGSNDKPGASMYGTIFKMTPSGTLTSLYSFCAQAGCPDGNNVYAGLVQGTDGNFYGTTQAGGAYGLGTVFRITPQGTFKTLYSFCAKLCSANDGGAPTAALLRTFNGPIYGATIGGTIFKLASNGKLMIVYRFPSNAGPAGALAEGSNGNIYGTTFSGGTKNMGTIFKMTLSGKVTTLYSFGTQKGCSDGQSPVAGLIQTTNGFFYGTTSSGGSSCGGFGTVFRFTNQGKLTTLHTFNQNDGANPTASLVQASDGNFYGTTSTGNGSLAAGAVFQITPKGAFTNLVTFNNNEGASPHGGLVQSTNGNLYGSTTGNAAYNGGTLFELNMGLAPFVTAIPIEGKIGFPVTIQGTNLSNASSVTFNGKAANFTLVSASEITTTVPNGATTGTVEVKTSNGTLATTRPFIVLFTH
jgi:uncharacterized repeat protein (TIGR03803 family)